MRTFGYSEFLFILEAAKWTIALSLIAFAGGAIGGLAVALARTSGSRLARAASTCPRGIDSMPARRISVA